MGDPQVVVLDEPTSGLDSLTAAVIVNYLSRLAHEQGKTIIMTIHQPTTDIFHKIDRLVLMVQGSLAYQGPSNESINYFITHFGLKCS